MGEYMKYEYKINSITNFNLDLPVKSFGVKNGNRVVLVSDFSTQHDGKTYLDCGIGDILNNALNFVKEHTLDNNCDKLVVFNYYPFKLSELTKISEVNRQKIIDACHDRLVNFLNVTKPDIVVFACDTSKYTGKNLLKYINNSYTINKMALTNKSRVSAKEIKWMHGRLFKTKIGEHKCQVMHTLPIQHVCPIDPRNYSTSDLLGFFIGDLGNAVYGYNRYTLPELKPDDKSWYTIIKNMDEWKSFYSKLTSGGIHCTDTEAANLNRTHGNKLLTIQSGFDGKHGFVIPYEHRESPFDEKQRKIIAKDFKKYFENGKSEYQVMHNGKFDCHIFRTMFGVEWFNHDLCDTQAIQYFLDENRVDLKYLGFNGSYALGNLSLEYGGFAYLDTNLSKKDRSNMSKHSLEDIAQYGAVDAIYPFKLAEFGFAEAKRRGEMYKGYKNAVLKLGGCMSYNFVEIEHNGIQIDKKYLEKMQLPNSPLVQGIREAKEKFYALPSVIQLNEKLAYEEGHKSKQGLFGKVKTKWVFSLGTTKHKQRLFFEELKLEPKKYGKSGLPSVDKDFIKEYKDTIPEVSLLNDVRSNEKLFTSNIVSYYKHITEDDDNKWDGRIRGHYKYHTILTSRTGSSNPNQQNIPARGKEAKIVKKQFIARQGYILFDFDLNANEVKNWGNVSNDTKIAESFGIGMILRRKLRIWYKENSDLAVDLAEYLKDKKWFEKETSVETKEKLAKTSNRFKEILLVMLDLETGGDVHRKNYSMFFGVPAHKVTPAQRSSVKTIVFGTLYKMSAMSLSRGIENGHISMAKEQLEKVNKEISTLKNEKTTKETKNRLQELVEQRKVLRTQARDLWKELDKEFKDDPVSLKGDSRYKELVKSAQGLINKMFSVFKLGERWIKKQEADGRKYYRIVNVLGMVRHLWGYSSTDKSLHSRKDRQGPNSVIQGPSSNINSLSGFLIRRFIWKTSKFGKKVDSIQINSVHDAVYKECKIEHLPIALYIAEQCAVDGLMNYCEKWFKWKMDIEPEISFSIGPNLGQMFEFDGTKPKLMQAVEEAIDYQIKEYGYSLDKESIMKKVSHNWDIMNDIRIKELKKKGSSLNKSVSLLAPEQLANLALNW